MVEALCKQSRRETIRILLINPPIRPTEIYSRFAGAAPRLPALGIRYLSAFMQRAGYDASVVDAAVSSMSHEDLRALITRQRPDVVGVTATTVALKSARDVVRMVKALPSRCLTILGGAHLSALPGPTMRECPGVDIGVVGEGEHTLLEICERHGRGEALDDVAGTVVHRDGKIHVNAARAPERNLDVFPPPDWDDLDGRRSYAHTPFRGSQSTVPLISSRGCPFGCGYCDQSVFGRTWRAHSAARVVEEMEQASRRSAASFVSFEDDNFLLDKDRVADLCRMLRRKNLAIEWGCSARVTSLDSEILAGMRSAGCRVIYVGIESASPRVLKLVDRRISTDKVRAGVSLIKRAGLRAYGSFVLGFPTETRREMRDTVRFALELPLDGASFFVFVPYPNTRLRGLAAQHGRVSDDWSDYSAHPQRPPYVPANIPAEALLRYQLLAYVRFFLRWKYVRHHLPTLVRPSFIMKTVPFLLGLRRNGNA